MEFPNTPGPGPDTPSLLVDQDKHVSSAVWEGQERGALRCHEHTSKLNQWELTPKQLDLVERAGFGHLRMIPAISLDNPLISSLVERWRKETNTFHMTVGEMTVTLEDVGYLLGLAIDGHPVTGVTYTSCDKVCQTYLGRVPDSKYTSGGMVKLSWLKEFFSNCPEHAPDHVVECNTRAYLLYLLGSTIFSTTTGNKVPVMYLQLLEDFDKSGTYAWGAAALAFLYRALGNASVKTQSTISGCLTMLQCWSYYHLNIGRPRLHPDQDQNRFPLVLRWKGKQNGPTTNRDVCFYRKALDSLTPNDVDWLPYSNVNSDIIPRQLHELLIGGLGRSQTMLICFDKAERHHPDRCLRQFGIPQVIPNEVKRWERKSRGVDGGVDLAGKMEAEIGEWFNRWSLIVPPADLVEDDPNYMPWYYSVTRRYVGRPIPISSEYTKMSNTLREIQHLIETISTDGMDDNQAGKISRIRNITHEVLKDHVGPSTYIADTPHDEQLVRRGRGKERVRRKVASKRKRKDELEYDDPSDGDQIHLADNSQLCAIDQQFHHSDYEGNPHIPLLIDVSHAVREVDDMDMEGLHKSDAASLIMHYNGSGVMPEESHLVVDGDAKPYCPVNESHWQTSEAMDEGDTEPFQEAANGYIQQEDSSLPNEAGKKSDAAENGEQGESKDGEVTQASLEAGNDAAKQNHTIAV